VFYEKLIPLCNEISLSNSLTLILDLLIVMLFLVFCEKTETAEKINMHINSVLLSITVV
jgi:hypothetical protein